MIKMEHADFYSFYEPGFMIRTMAEDNSWISDKNEIRLSKGLFTPVESESETEKDQSVVKKIKV